MTLTEFAANRLVSSFSRFGDKFDYAGVKLLLECFPDRFTSYKNTVIIFLRLDDVSYLALKSGLLDIRRPGVLFPLFYENGPNVHILNVCSDSMKDMFFLVKWCKDKSVSWFKRDFSGLVYFERS